MGHCFRGFNFRYLHTESRPAVIGADFHRATVATAPRETPQRAPTCEELDPLCVFVQKIYYLFLGKSTKTAATRAAIFDSNMHQIVSRLGLRPRPHWGSLQRSPRLYLWGLLLNGERRREKESRGEDRKGEEGREGEERSSSFIPGIKKKSRKVGAYMPAVCAYENKNEEVGTRAYRQTERQRKRGEADE